MGTRLPMAPPCGGDCLSQPVVATHASQGHRKWRFAGWGRHSRVTSWDKAMDRTAGISLSLPRWLRSVCGELDSSAFLTLGEIAAFRTSSGGEGGPAQAWELTPECEQERVLHAHLLLFC